MKYKLLKYKEYEVQIYGDVVFVREKNKISDHDPTDDLIHTPQLLALYHYTAEKYIWRN